MQILKERKVELIVTIFFIALYFLSRLVFLTNIPIFTDEAIYLRWAQIARDDASWRFISLTDGKQPLFIWLTMIAMKTVSDPLIAGRIISVLSGFLTAMGLFFLSKEIFKEKWIGIIAAGLYVIYPFAVVYDRLALYDSLVGTFAVWSLYGTVLLIKSLRLDIALLLGFVTGGAVLNKTSGFFSIFLLPFSLMLFDWKKRDLKKRILSALFLFGVVTIMTYGIYAILRLSPFFYIIEEKNAVFVYPFKDWIQHPFAYFWQNFRALSDWLVTYMGFPLILLAGGSIFLQKTFVKEKILLILWFGLPFIALALFGKTLYPRYIFFMTLSLLPLVAYSIYIIYEKLKEKLFLRSFFVVLALFYPLVSSLLILTDFKNALIPFADKSQYFTGWPSGVGIPETINFFREKAKKSEIFIGTEGTFGLLPYAYELYFLNNKNITVKGYWPIGPEIYPELVKISLSKPTYIVFYQDCVPCEAKGIAPHTWPLKKIMQISKVEKDTYVTVYQVIPQ